MVVVILEHWEVVLTLSESDSGIHENVIVDFTTHLTDATELAVLGVPASFGDPIIDAKLRQIELLLFDLAEDREDLKVVTLPSDDELQFDGNTVTVGPGWPPATAAALETVLDAVSRQAS